MRKLFDLGSDLRYGAHMARLHRGKDLVTSLITKRENQVRDATPILACWPKNGKARLKRASHFCRSMNPAVKTAGLVTLAGKPRERGWPKIHLARSVPVRRELWDRREYL
jgi:hypothetical protein